MASIKKSCVCGVIHRDIPAERRIRVSNEENYEENPGNSIHLHNLRATRADLNQQQIVHSAELGCLQHLFSLLPDPENDAISVVRCIIERGGDVQILSKLLNTINKHIKFLEVKYADYPTLNAGRMRHWRKLRQGLINGFALFDSPATSNLATRSIRDRLKHQLSEHRVAVLELMFMFVIVCIILGVLFIGREK